ncbi:hypothetical protein [Streptomyces sp. NPDC058066]|uniref:hypothetical protein n=1 Tax=Streptomyces sp. NPDC058066 TaxID=3346323 RepID=UPI0036E9EB9B
MSDTGQASAVENELVDLRAKYELVVGERDGLRRRVHQLLAQRGPVTDSTDCTCPPQGGDS